MESHTCALIVHNLQVFHRHGWKGKYPSITPDKKEELEKEIKDHPAQSSRYLNPFEPNKKRPRRENPSSGLTQTYTDILYRGEQKYCPPAEIWFFYPFLLIFAALERSRFPSEGLCHLFFIGTLWEPLGPKNMIFSKFLSPTYIFPFCETMKTRPTNPKPKLRIVLENDGGHSGY